MVKMEVLFESYYPQASLLHGDLWGGNWAVTSAGCPVLFDPATYYGDRETDIAMTELFSGFPQEFYKAYSAQWPLPPVYAHQEAPLSASLDHPEGSTNEPAHGQSHLPQ